MPCTQAPVTGEQGSEPAKGAQEMAQPNKGLKTLTGACEQARVTHWPAETRPPSIRTLAAATAVCHRSVPCDPTSRDGHGVILGDKAEPSQPSAASGCADPHGAQGVGPSPEVRQPAPATALLLEPTKRLTLHMLGRTTLCSSSASSQRVSEKCSQIQGKICSFCGLGRRWADLG